MSAIKAVRHQVGSNATASKNIVLEADSSTGDLVIYKGVHDGTLTEIQRIRNDGSGMSFIPAGTGAVETTVQAKLRQSVSVKDFGATGNGTDDDTAQIKLAITAAGVGGRLIFPKGTYIISALDATGVCLRQKSGQSWVGEGAGISVIKLNPSMTTFSIAIRADDGATDCSIQDMTIDGNRDEIVPSIDLYSTMSLVIGASGGKRSVYKNLVLQNSWGRTLQTSNESYASKAEEVVIDNVHVLNSGTKGISATNSKRVSITNCYSQINPYTAAENPAGAAATSGSCFEVNKSEDVSISNSHGIQVGSSIIGPGVRLINGSLRCTVFGNTITDAAYVGFIENVSGIKFFSNIGNINGRGYGFLISDDDVNQPLDPCLNIDVHDNTIYGPTSAFLVSCVKPGYDSYVDTNIYNNRIVGIPGVTTHGIYNYGVASPATGGLCTVRQWNNLFTDVERPFAGAAAHEIQGAPDKSWRVIGKSAVSVSHTGSTAEVTLAAVTFLDTTTPPARMGKNGIIRVTAHWSYTNSANAKITRVRFGGYQATSSSNTASTQQKVQVEIANRNSLTSQVVSIAGNTSGSGVSTTAAVLSVDTTDTINVTLTAQLSAAGVSASETIVLESYIVELLHGL